jgi:hypothetical protein
VRQIYSNSLLMRLSSYGINSSLATSVIFLFDTLSICLMSEKLSETKFFFSIHSSKSFFFLINQDVILLLIKAWVELVYFLGYADDRGETIIFLYSESSRPTLCPSQPTIRCVPEGFPDGKTVDA